MVSNRKKPTMRYLVGNDAESMLIDLWMDGFTSGVSTAAKSMGLPDQVGDRMADAASASVRRDPLAVEMVRQQIHERFTGRDSGPRDLHVDATCRSDMGEGDHCLLPLNHEGPCS